MYCNFAIKAASHNVSVETEREKQGNTKRPQTKNGHEETIDRWPPYRPSTFQRGESIYTIFIRIRQVAG